MTKYLRKKTRLLKRRLKRYAPSASIYAALIGIGALLIGAGYVSNQKDSINPVVYKPLLELIARAESNGNYNAYFGHSSNSAIDFTSMSIKEVQDWQAEYVRQGSPSSAVGRYQIIDSTLHGLVDQLGISPTDRFDEATQDRMAVKLLERRGVLAYVNKQMTSEEFAANLAQEWAALPSVSGVNPDESYYAADGINQSRVKVSEILAVINSIGS